MAQLIFDKRETPSCVRACIREYDSKCPGRTWSRKREEMSNYCSLFELVDCLCPCHDNDSEPLDYEQKEWLKRRMCLPMGEHYKPFPGIEISLKWGERT